MAVVFKFGVVLLRVDGRAELISNDPSCYFVFNRTVKSSMETIPSDCTNEVFGYLHLNEVCCVQPCSRRLRDATVISFGVARGHIEIDGNADCPRSVMKAFGVLRLALANTIRFESLQMVRPPCVIAPCCFVCAFARLQEDRRQ